MNQPREVPIFRAPAHVQCDVGPIVCWYTNPPGAVFQLMETTRMTHAVATWVAGSAFNGMLARFSESRSFCFLIDIRAMTEREPSVRGVFMKLARDSGSLLPAAVIIPPRRANPLYLGGLQTASALLAPFGTTLEITAGLQEALQRYRLQPVSA